MKLFVSIDAPDVARRIERLSMANEANELRQVNQNTDHSRAIWPSWVILHGGSIISENGAAVRLEIPADVVDELEPLRARYATSLDSKVAVGLGTELHHADRSLQAAVKMGGGILPYSDYVEEVLDDKPKEELLQPMSKADVAENPHARTGPSQPSRPSVDKPVASQGDHSATEAALETIESSERPPPMEGTHAGADFEDQLHGHAQAQDDEDRRQARAASQDYDSARQKVVQALQFLRDQAPVMDQIKAQAPDAYQAMIGLSQAVVELSRMLRGAAPSEGAAIQKSEVDDIDSFPALQKMAVLHDNPAAPATVYRVQNELGHGPYRSPENDAMDEKAPWREMPDQSRGGYNDRNVEVPHFAFPKNEHKHLYSGKVKFGFVKPEHAQEWFGQENLKYLERSGFKVVPVLARRAWITPSGKQIMYEPHQEMTKEELDKALPSPESDGVPSKHPLQLPVGAMHGPKMKVMHGATGKTGWVQMEAGMIRSQDSTGHPISSRNPKGK